MAAAEEPADTAASANITVHGAKKQTKTKTRKGKTGAINARRGAVVQSGAAARCPVVVSLACRENNALSR